MALPRDELREEALGGVPAGGDRCVHGRASIRTTAAEELAGLYRFAAARVGGALQAEDSVQQALLIALAHSSPPDDRDLQRAWLRGVLRNVIRRQARSQRRGRRAMERFEVHMSERQGRPDHPASDSQERASAVRSLFLAITELDRADQDLFYEFYHAGRSHAAIAEDLGTTPKGVEARLYRLRARLRSALSSGAECEPW